MKRFLSIVFLLTFGICANACSSDDGDSDVNVPDVTIAVTPAELNFGCAASSLQIEVDASAGYSVISNVDWCTCSPVGGVKGKQTFTVSVTRNPLEEERETELIFKSGSYRQSLRVTQEKMTGIVAPEGYKLVWQDEFETGTVLNSTDWTHEVQGSGWVNNELQNYVNGEIDGKRVTEISDGNLYINCFKHNGKVYSGRVYAHVGTGWRYGYIEARIKLPKGKGTWPAFWMMPVTVDWANEGWPKCGEIDIMEEVGVVPNEVSSSLHAEGHNHTNGTQVTHAMTIDKAEGEFHVYAIEWTAENITTYVDGKVQLSYDNDGQGVRNWPYDKPYYIILNLAWGGSWGGMQGVDESALPVSMVVDYVRVFQQKYAERGMK